jgi:hypothetical protein
MAKGRKTGGRVKGVPNKVTGEAREAFRAVYEGRLSDLDRWIQETGDGFEVPMRLKTGEPLIDPETSKPRMMKIGKDPGKAADLLLRMAEHFIPKLQRHEQTGEGGGPIRTSLEVAFVEPAAKP